MLGTSLPEQDAEVDNGPSRLLAVPAFVKAGILFLLIALGGIAINELVNRSGSISRIKGELVEINTQLANDLRNHLRPIPQANIEGSTFPISRRMIDLEYRRFVLRLILEKLELLSTSGAHNSCDTVRALRTDSTPLAGNACIPRNFLAIAQDQIGLSYWGDEALFFTLALCFGAIGSLLGGLKINDFRVMRDLSLGLGGGLIVYLALRSGLVPATTQATTAQIYFYAFAAVVVGLFTDRAHDVLSNLITKYTKKLNR